MLVRTIAHVIRSELYGGYNPQQIVVGPNEPEEFVEAVKSDDELVWISQLMKSKTFLEDMEKFMKYCEDVPNATGEQEEVKEDEMKEEN